MTEREATEGMRQVLAIFLEAVKAGGEHGAPAGHMYAALQDCVSLDQFNAIMGVLVKAGKVRKRGDLYFAA